MSTTVLVLLLKMFYLQHFPKIFPYRNRATKIFKALFGPQYDGKYLQKVLRENLQGKRVHDTLTNIVIPTYDIEGSELVIFSSYKLQDDESLDAELSDICIGSSATPTYYHSQYFHKFHTKDSQANVLREFKLVDVGVASKNPTMVAIGEAFEDVKRRNPDSAEYGRLLVLSLGSGEEHYQKKYDSQKSSTWDILCWLDRKLYDVTSLVDIATRSNDGMVDYLALQAVGSEENYLRIQDDIPTVDLAIKSNLENLVKVGEDMLKKPMTRLNMKTSMREPCHHTSNEQALKQFAQKLHEEKKACEPRSEIAKC